MIKKLRSFWATRKIKTKISFFTGSVFVIVLFSIIFDAWIVRLFMFDFNDIMTDNMKGGQIVGAVDRETEAFTLYVRSGSADSKASLDEAIKSLEDSVESMNLDYKRLGDNRFSQLQSLKSLYTVYCDYRDEVISGGLEGREYVEKLYCVYDMQKYLYDYAGRYADTTLKEGNDRYNEILPVVFILPAVTIIISILMFFAILEISRAMNKSVTEPVLKLADASRKIAANDFYIDDVRADNRDELGELITAFNKMKYATGEYIDALEEKREALDRLHAKELETLEAEKQLDAMNLELLKNQINPHFLFNTLNVIGGMANLESAPTTEKMAVALSSIFRYNLKTQEKEVLLSRELKVSDDYMYLQKMRFGERVKYEVNCEVDADGVMVPTFTLQPLLENAVIHGISPKISGGEVKVNIKRDGDLLMIEVWDTGKGISPEDLKDLRDSLYGKRNLGIGIGLGNIYRRLKSMYPGSDMKVDSVLGVGSKITILVPYKEDNKGEET
ncbi:MAG: sensor histidine kinase [Lachnospiraceae bacterium]|nr:sensor histidine kinase [Lachnospiraceae bacterium]